MISQEFLEETDEAVAEEQNDVPNDEGVKFDGFTYVSQ